MAFNEKLADTLRELLLNESIVTEKHLFGGVCFMVNDKMCIGIVKDELMCRLDPQMAEQVIEEHGVRPMDFNGKPMKGYVFVSIEILRTKKDFQRWVSYCLDFNPLAKASKKRKN